MATFLSSWHIENLRSYKYNVDDRSILSQMYQPLWNKMLLYIPETIHPNMLTFCSFACVLVAYRLSLGLQFTSTEDATFDNMALRPFWLIIAIQFLASAYMHLDALDGKQARRLRCSSPIGELLDHALDNIGMIFGVLTLLNAWGISSSTHTYLLTFACSIGFFQCHLDAYLGNKSGDQVIEFGRWSGPCEAIIAYKAVVFAALWRKYVYLGRPEWCELFSYIPIVVAAATGLYLLDKLRTTWNDAQRSPWVIGSLFVYGIRIACAAYHVLETGGAPLEAKWYILEGLLLSCVTTEVILCKMAKAPFSPLLLLLAMVGWLNEWAGILCSVAYYVQLFWGLSDALNLSLVRLKRRVYCCGVFDMCHRGHMNLFKRCLHYGETVVVGVHSDEAVMSYKHNPVVPHEERAQTVEHCKCVGEVIRNAPLTFDEKFLKDNRIDCVVCSDEYDSPTDKYYAVARKAGILHVLGRTDGISSTTIRSNASQPRLNSVNNLADLAEKKGLTIVTDNHDDQAPSMDSPRVRSKSPGSKAKKQK